MCRNYETPAAPSPAGKHASLHAELIAITDQLEPDAVRALTLIAHRLLKGQKAYGRIDVATDPRDWQKEREEELQDALVYGAFASLKAGAK